MHQELSISLDKLSASLDLTRQVVGIKFIESKDEYEKYHATEVKSHLSYCVMVKLASQGYMRKSTLEHHACCGATRAIGLEDPAPNFATGESYNTFYIYKDVEVSKQVASHITLKKTKIYGVVTGPLSSFEDLPDVVLTITNPYNAMRIVQGYTFHYGTHTAFKMAGNQAICAESTSYPYESDAINISLLCCGTRHSAKWSENELCIGLPIAKFLMTCDGVYHSINGAEPDNKKALIRKTIAGKGLQDPGIHDGDAYFIRLA